MSAMHHDPLIINERRVDTSVSLAKAEKRKNAYLASMPLDWILRAGKLPGKAMQVAVAIRHQCRLEKQTTINLGNTLLQSMGVKVDAKRRALEVLEQEGLIKVTHHNGAKPTVTIT